MVGSSGLASPPDVKVLPAIPLANGVRVVGKKQSPKTAKTGRGRPRAEKPKDRRIGFRLRADLAEGLDAYLASLRPRPTDTSVMEVALEDYLRGKGFWPPPAGPEEK